MSAEKPDDFTLLRSELSPPRGHEQIGLFRDKAGGGKSVGTTALLTHGLLEDREREKNTGFDQ